MLPGTERASVYQVVRTETEFSWLKGKRKTRILSREPLSANQAFHTLTGISSGVEIRSIGNNAVIAQAYGYDPYNPDEYHTGLPRELVRQAINSDPKTKEIVRYVPQNLALNMKATRSSRREVIQGVLVGAMNSCLDG